MPPASLEQIRARRAYDAVAQHPELAEWAESLPTMLQTNGLLATWAYLLSKPKARQALITLFDHLRRWENRLNDPSNPRDAFADWIGDGQGQLSGSRLRRLTEEAIAFAAWLKRAGQAGGGDE